MQHRSHLGHPQHINHHVHQQMHHGLPPPPMGMNVGPQMGPPPTQQQQHHLSNAPPHGAPQSKVYIPPQQSESHRFGHRLLQQQPQHRINSQMHQNQMQQTKVRPLSKNHGGSMPMPSLNHQKNKFQQNNKNAPLQNLPQLQKPPPKILQRQKPSYNNRQFAPPPVTSINLNTHPPPPLPPYHSQSRHPLTNSHPPPLVNHKASPPAISTRHPPAPAQPISILQNPDRKILPVSTKNSTTTEQFNLENKPKLIVANRIKPTNDNLPQGDEQNVVEEEKTPPLNTILDSSEHDSMDSREKTPMCLVNELARFNKVQHQYRLTGEIGPPHSKRFTVTLKLGDEEYCSEGPSIKKAQHIAAAEAVCVTKYEHPPPKIIRLKNFGRSGNSNITPTVELNALAMKIGQPTVYMYDNPSQSAIGLPGGPIGGNHNHIPPQINQIANMPMTSHHPQNAYMPSHGQNNIYMHDGGQHGNKNQLYSNGRFQQRKNYLRYHPQRIYPFNAMGGFIAHKEICKITLMVGKEKFVGVGPTVQSAKHDAAKRALEILKPLQPPLADANESRNSSLEDSNPDEKSPISLVHEMALKLNMNATFEVKSELGPPHMRTFVTICKVGNTITEGEGKGKKISKKRAAEKMMEELQKLPPLSPSKIVAVNKVKTFKRKPPVIKKKTRNALIKEKTDEESQVEVNSISRLIQIQQALKEAEPVYRVIEEKGAPRRREFIVEVEASGNSATGYGTTKKIAKKNAAKNLLIIMGYERASSPNKDDSDSTITTEPKPERHRKVKFSDTAEESASVTISDTTTKTDLPVVVTTSPIQGGNSGRQIVPGMLIVPAQKKAPSADNSDTEEVRKPTTVKDAVSKIEETTKSATPKASTSEGVRPKDQLIYLSQLLGFNAEFSDYPKGNHGEFLTIVTLSTDPPQICHGAGPDTETSQDKAAATALQILSQLNLDTKSKKIQETPHEQSDDDKGMETNSPKE